LVDLAPLTDASLVAQTIATTLGIRDEPGRLVIDALTEYLRNRHVLLILDNCEHLIDACAQVVGLLLRSCAHVQVLATSRELFGVAGEATWRVAPLSLANRQDPADGSEDWAAKVLASESGRLFFDRAQLVVQSFAITAQNAPAVAQVCRRLDGIPLAIELAAARLSMLSVDQIASRLDQRFRLLTGGSRTAVRRQQTLQATIDWSYQLLTEEERSLVRRLAVFAGGWSLEAAEALGADPMQPREDVFELLSRLVAKSMVLVEEPLQNEPRVLRYRFL
jgi:predicted ATPase